MGKASHRLKVWTGWIATGLMLIGAVVVRNASTELMAPARRPLLDYHRDWLEHPSEHGMKIQRFSAMEGQVPCLLVQPDGRCPLPKRAEAVRRQLQEKGIALAPFGGTFATLVLLHGRNGRKEDLLPVAERFCSVGFRCVIPDLPAHGESPLKIVRFGTSDFEASIPSKVLAEAAARFDFPSDPTGLWGMSMGGAFLARAASLPDSPWKALVVVCSFDSLEMVVRQKAASYAGIASPLFYSIISRLSVARGGVDPSAVLPSKWAATVMAPVLVAHGEKDLLITPSQGQRLYDAYGSPDKAWILVKGGDHNRVLVTEHPLYAEMAAWYLKYLRPL